MINFMQILCQFNLKRFGIRGAPQSTAAQTQTKSYFAQRKFLFIMKTGNLQQQSLTNYLPIMHQCWSILNPRGLVFM